MRRAVTIAFLVIAFISIFALGRISRSDGDPSVANNPPTARHPTGCTEATMKGTWGFSSQGTHYGTDEILRFAVVGLMTYDGEGKIHGSETLNSSREVRDKRDDGKEGEGAGRGIERVIRERTFAGNYTVKSNCTGSITINYDGGDPSVRADCVIVNDGKECLFIGRDEISTTGVSKKQ
ncbi:MAG: hypothetical protein HYR55_04270 [Acidobacteria bacterium]|nr:hypothetical protein [Acidobacteriota bacterium]MBI3658674.1 hypothetical protein [Acidobacteriota bacterium]